MIGDCKYLPMPKRTIKTKQNRTLPNESENSNFKIFLEGKEGNKNCLKLHNFNIKKGTNSWTSGPVGALLHDIGIQRSMKVVK